MLVRLIQLVDFFNGILPECFAVPMRVYPLQFPYNTTSENVMVLDIVNGDFKGTIRELNIQFMTRSTHPSVAEEQANTLVSFFHNMTNRTHEDWQVILIQSTQPNPFLNGQDDNARYMYTVDFRLLVTKIN